jgi:hypothetical protein
VRRSDEVGLSVRPVSVAEGEELDEMLSPRTVYERFHAPYSRVPRWILDGMMEADHYDREAIVAATAGEIVGHAMYVSSKSY